MKSRRRMAGASDKRRVVVLLLWLTGVALVIDAALAFAWWKLAVGTLLALGMVIAA